MLTGLCPALSLPLVSLCGLGPGLLLIVDSWGLPLVLVLSCPVFLWPAFASAWGDAHHARTMVPLVKHPTTAPWLVNFVLPCPIPAGNRGSFVSRFSQPRDGKFCGNVSVVWTSFLEEIRVAPLIIEFRIWEVLLLGR